VEEIRAQLAYREENAKALEDFHPDRVFGEDEKIYVDSAKKMLVVTSASDFRDENPDIIHAEQIISCETSIDDDEEELFMTDKEGNEKSYDPPRYRHAYEFHITFKIDSPWFDEISVDLNNGNRPESKDDDLYSEYNMRMLEIAGLVRQWNYKPRPEDVLLGPIPGYFENLRAQQQPMEGMGSANGAEFENSAASPKTDEPLPEGSWKCFCGKVNSGKFCSECGRPRS